MAMLKNRIAQVKAFATHKEGPAVDMTPAPALDEKVGIPAEPVSADPAPAPVAEIAVPADKPAESHEFPGKPKIAAALGDIRARLNKKKDKAEAEPADDSKAKDDAAPAEEAPAATPEAQPEEEVTASLLAGTRAADDEEKKGFNLNRIFSGKRKRASAAAFNTESDKAEAHAADAEPAASSPTKQDTVEVTADTLAGLQAPTTTKRRSFGLPKLHRSKSTEAPEAAPAATTPTDATSPAVDDAVPATTEISTSEPATIEASPTEPTTTETPAAVESKKEKKFWLNFGKTSPTTESEEVKEAGIAAPVTSEPAEVEAEAQADAPVDGTKSVPADEHKSGPAWKRLMSISKKPEHTVDEAAKDNQTAEAATTEPVAATTTEAAVEPVAEATPEVAAEPATKEKKSFLGFFGRRTSSAEVTDEVAKPEAKEEAVEATVEASAAADSPVVEPATTETSAVDATVTETTATTPVKPAHTRKSSLAAILSFPRRKSSNEPTTAATPEEPSVTSEEPVVVSEEPVVVSEAAVVTEPVEEIKPEIAPEPAAEAERTPERKVNLGAGLTRIFSGRRKTKEPVAEVTEASSAEEQVTEHVETAPASEIKADEPAAEASTAESDAGKKGFALPSLFAGRRKSQVSPVSTQSPTADTPVESAVEPQAEAVETLSDAKHDEPVVQRSEKRNSLYRLLSSRGKATKAETAEPTAEVAAPAGEAPSTPEAEAEEVIDETAKTTESPKKPQVWKRLGSFRKLSAVTVTPSPDSKTDTGTPEVADAPAAAEPAAVPEAAEEKKGKVTLTERIKSIARHGRKEDKEADADQEAHDKAIPLTRSRSPVAPEAETTATAAYDAAKAPEAAPATTEAADIAASPAVDAPATATDAPKA